MGTAVETLADLFPAGPRAVCVGVNPAPVSVRAGHYYQGPLGKRFLRRLRQVGLLGETSPQFEDDALYGAGIGFTDLVKRPTAHAAEVTIAERRHGVRVLTSKLDLVHAPALIFPFKEAAVAILGRFDDNGWLRVGFAGARLFVMPGPYEETATAESTIASLVPGLGAGLTRS